MNWALLNLKNCIYFILIPAKLINPKLRLK